MLKRQIFSQEGRFAETAELELFVLLLGLGAVGIILMSIDVNMEKGMEMILYKNMRGQ